MTEESAHSVAAPLDGTGSDPADRGGEIGSGLVPEESVEGAAEAAAHRVAGQPHEGLVEPGGIDTEDTR
jgi:hypothetical protein